MPGIIVDRLDEDYLEVKVPYFKPYSNRISHIDGAEFIDDDIPYWQVPVESAEELDEEFEGELIYNIPRHELLGIPGPRPPKVLKKVPSIKVDGLKGKPHKFQTFGMNFCAYVMEQKGFAILGDLMGTGKTFQSIGTAKLLKQQGKVKKVLCVVLAPTRPQWAKEIAKFTDEACTVFADFKAKYSRKNGKSQVVDSVDDQKKRAIEEFKKSDDMFLIMSYQTMQQNEAIIEKGEFDMVIFDEAHYMKNRESKTNKAAKQLVKNRTKKHKKGYNKGLRYVLFVSGTPIMNYPDEIYGMVGVANDKYLGTYREFRKEYLQLNEFQDIVGYKNLDKLTQKTKSVLIRRTDDEVGLNLPKISEQDIEIDPHPIQLKLDKELKNYQQDLINEKNALLAQGKKSEAEAVSQRLKGVSNHRISASCHPNLFLMSANEGIRDRYGKFAVKNPYDIPKFDRCIEMVKEIVGNGHKVVIFVESRRMTVLLHKEIKKFTRAVRYIGGLSDEVRERRKEKFNTDPSCKVMIANSAGSTGLNLQAGRYLINYDLPHTPAIWEQRKYRIRRLDSTHDRVFFYNLLNRGMIDESMMNKLSNKKAAFNAVIENDASQKEAHKSMIGKKKKKQRTNERTNKRTNARKKKTVVRDDDDWAM